MKQSAIITVAASLAKKGDLPENLRRAVAAYMAKQMADDAVSVKARAQWSLPDTLLSAIGDEPLSAFELQEMALADDFRVVDNCLRTLEKNGLIAGKIEWRQTVSKGKPVMRRVRVYVRAKP